MTTALVVTLAMAGFSAPPAIAQNGAPQMVVGTGNTRTDTAAVLAALATGQAWSCTGVLSIDQTLEINAAKMAGMVITGTGAASTAAPVTTAGRCVFQPTAAVTKLFDINGAALQPVPYLTKITFRDLAIDADRMAPGSVVFSETLAFDIAYDNVTVYGDAGKIALQLNSGAYTTIATNLSAHEVSCAAAPPGRGGAPTTLTLVNPDIQDLEANVCASITTDGGAVQPVWKIGATPVRFIASGYTNLVGFYPTVEAFDAAKGTTGGIYYAVGSTLASLSGLASNGTDWEANGHAGNGCAVNGYTGDTYDDGRNGCHPILWVLHVAPRTSRCQFSAPIFANEYLWTLGSGCTVLGLSSGAPSAETTNGGESSSVIIDGSTGIIQGDAYRAGSIAGVSCSGRPTASYAVTKGIVTHC